MPAGLQVIGDHSIIQLDETYQNLFLVASGTATTPSSPNQGLGYLNNITGMPTRTSTSITVLSSTATACVIVAAPPGGTSMDVYSIKPDSAFKWWVFDVLTGDSANSNYLQTYTWDSQLIFDAGRKPMKVLGNITYICGTAHDTGYTASSSFTGYDIGLAFMDVATAHFSGPSGGPGATPNYSYVAGMYQPLPSKDIVSVTGRFTTFGGAPDQSFSHNGQALVIDLTGY